MYEIGMINKLTGEVLDPDVWEGIVLNPPAEEPENLLINLNKKGTRFDSSNLHLSIKEKGREVKKQKSVKDHPEYGKHINLTSHRQKYSKVFHRHIPQFTNLTYKAFWFDLTVRLTKDTNIIYCIENKKIRFAHSRQDLMKICTAKQSKFYEFYRECLEKSFIAEFITNKTIFIINPHYALNGSGIPKELYDLFNKSVEKYQREYDKDQGEDK